MVALTAETMLLAAGRATHFARSCRRSSSSSSSTSYPLSASVIAVVCNPLQFLKSQNLLWKKKIHKNNKTCSVTSQTPWERRNCMAGRMTEETEFYSWEGQENSVFFRASYGSGDHPALHSTGNGTLSSGYSGQFDRLTTYLHLMPTLRRSGVIPPGPIRSHTVELN
jgi:hypothetical protein